MKPVTPHDPLDDLIAAALHGELSPEERAQFDARLANDPAARAAYQEAQLMHAMLEGTFAGAQPDPGFEQRMVSGERRRIGQGSQRETAWESALVLWRAIKKGLRPRRLTQYAVIFAMLSVVVGSVLVSLGNQVKGVFTTISSQLAYAGSSGYAGSTIVNGGTSSMVVMSGNTPSYIVDRRGLADAQKEAYDMAAAQAKAPFTALRREPLDAQKMVDKSSLRVNQLQQQIQSEQRAQAAAMPAAPTEAPAFPNALMNKDLGALAASDNSEVAASATVASLGKAIDGNAAPAPPPPPTQTTTPAPDTRKLIRNANLDLEVKSFPTAMDQITALTKAAGGYVDTSNAQRGGNGKLQGTVVVKILPPNLDAFLLKLRDLGTIKNQSVSTEDVTKDYFDTQARLDNSRKMEVQLQQLLARNNGKVSDLLEVERELGRVRGEIEQMQGSLKLYDFQVAYATVTMTVSEKDLNQAAAYLLKEQDNFSLFATNVEDTFQKARQAADDFKAQILAANLNHNSGSDVTAELVVMVAPDQIEPFLAQIRSLGRVANFTRETQRVAKDGGDSDQPADETLTEKDKVQVHLAIRSDDESRKQVALTVVTSAVDTALDQAKTAALASAGTEILSSSLNKTPQGQTTAQLSVRVPGKDYHTLLEAFRALGRTASFSLQRDDNSGPGANGDEAPVIVSLALTDDDAPLQETEMAIVASEVDDQAQQLKKDAAAAGVEVKASSFARQPNGTEIAEMTFRMPMAKYPAFLDSLKKLGRVESLTVRRDDRPDESRTDDTAPAEISLRMHNQGDLVTDDNGLGTALRQTFGAGLTALFASVRVIGVIIAFLIPWVVTLFVLAWVGRRIYLWRKK